MKRRFISFLVTLAMIFTLLPQAAAVAYAAPKIADVEPDIEPDIEMPPAMTLGVDALKTGAGMENAQTVWLGQRYHRDTNLSGGKIYKCEWYVIAWDGKDGNGEDITYTDSTGTEQKLYEEDTVTLLLKGKSGHDTIRQFSTFGNYYMSMLNSYIQAVYGERFEHREFGAVRPRSLPSTIYDKTEDAYMNEAKMSYPEIVTSSFFWLLSEAEAANVPVSIRSEADSHWWLRSPGYTSRDTAFIFKDSEDSNHIDYGTATYEYGVIRPACYLNSKNVLFTSSPEFGKVSNEVGVDCLREVDTTPYTDWKVTLHDSDRDDFQASISDDVCLHETEDYFSWYIPVEFSGAGTNENDFVSAMITDEEGNILYYGNLSNGSETSPADGAYLRIPNGLKVGNYQLHIFDEEVNGGNNTDYSSEFTTFDLVVKTAVDMEMEVAEISEGEDETFTITGLPTDAAGEVIIVVYDPNEQEVGRTTAEVKDGKAVGTIKDLKEGEYYAVAEYTGDDKYGNADAFEEFKVGPKKPDPTPDPKPTPTPDPKPDPVPVVKGKPLVRMTAKGKKALVIEWGKADGAEGYDIFFAPCNYGTKNKIKKIKTIKGNSTFKYTKKGLKANSGYKAVVKAWVMVNGKKKYVKKSPMVHGYTSGGTKIHTNPKAVKVNKKKVTLKKGKTFKIKAKIIKVDDTKKLTPVTHAPRFRYYSDNTDVAKVSKTGKIKAKGKGKCKVYVYAANGVYKIVNVTVK